MKVKLMSKKSERFEMRLDPTLMNRIDQWRDRQVNVSRAEAARELILHGLDKTNSNIVNISDGEKIIIAQISDLTKDKQHREIDTALVMKTIQGGHSWALRWQMPGLLDDHIDQPGMSSLVNDTLDMWCLIEESIESFSSTEKKAFHEEPNNHHHKFLGFDDNNESEYHSIALFLVNDLDHFPRFKGRDLNSHLPVIDSYARMIPLFQQMRVKAVRRRPIRLTLNEVLTLLKEGYP